MKWFLLILLSVIWGCSFIIMDRALFAPDGSPVISPVQLGALRMFLTGLVLIPHLLYHIRTVIRKNWGFLFVTALIGNGVPALLFAFAQTKLPSSYSGMLNSLTPVFALIIGLVFFKVKITKIKVIGILVGFLGAIGLIVTRSQGGLNLSGELGYSLMAVSATVCYAISLNIISTKLGKFTPLEITSFSFGMCVPVWALVLYFAGVLDTMAEAPRFWISLSWVSVLAILSTAVAVILFNHLIQKSSAIFASYVTYLMPLVSMILGYWDGEHVPLSSLIWISLILGGVYLTGKKKEIPGKQGA